MPCSTCSSRASSGGISAQYGRRKLPPEHPDPRGRHSRSWQRCEGSASRSTTATADGSNVSPLEPAAGLFTRAAYRSAFTGHPGVGPFWTNFDGSRVVGTAPAAVSSPSPDPVQERSVALAQGCRAPPGTGGTFSNVQFIQRIDTRGGQSLRRHAASTHGRRGLHRDLRVLGTQVTITPPNRRDGRPSVAAVRRFAYLRRRKSRPSSDRASEIRRLRPFATVWSIPREPECCHPARVLGRRPS